MAAAYILASPNSRWHESAGTPIPCSLTKGFTKIREGVRRWDMGCAILSCGCPWLSLCIFAFLEMYLQKFAGNSPWHSKVSRTISNCGFGAGVQAVHTITVHNFIHIDDTLYMHTLDVILAYSITCICSILQAVQFYIEQLEHTDQVVRTGACSALCSLGVSTMSHLKLDTSL